MLSIPIISEFDGNGIDKAIKEFKQLETAGEKAQFAIKKAAVPATAAITAVAGALSLATAAAIEDEAQQAQLAQTMKNVTGATDAQVAATEEMIASMSRASGTADSELRPAFAELLRGTKDVEQATSALGLAQDIAIGSNKSLSEVSKALSQAYAGNMEGLQSLSPEIKTMIKDGATLDEVMATLSGTFGGAAATAANTAAGKFKILKNSISETQESIGAGLLPVVEKVLPVLQKFADWAQKNPKAFLAIASAITAISVAILAVNFAMSLNPFTAIAAGVAALVVGLVYAYNKFEWFRNGLNSLLNSLLRGFELWANGFIGAINLIIRGMNLINPFTDMPLIPLIDLPSIGGGSAPSAYSGDKDLGVKISSPNIQMPSIVTPPPPLTPGAGTGGGAAAAVATGGGFLTSYPSGIAERIANRESSITVNVNGGLASSAEIGTAVVNALRAFNRQNGPANIQVA